jgi:uncharacterized protein (TIGR02145 family)
MKRISKCILLLVFSILTTSVFSQGINFQGVARSANGTIIASSNISLRLSIISKNVDATPEYIETKTVVTNAQGIFSVVVGDAANAVVTGNFKNIAWKDGIKFLKVEMDPSAGTNYINMGATQLQYVPYSFYSLGVDAANVTGILPIEKGGTGVASISDLKVALVLDKVNNTADLAKPISTLTQTALDLKLNTADTSKYTKQTYSDSALSTKLSTTGTASTATKLATARNINGVAFDGSGDITVTLDAGTLTGTILKSTVVGSSLTSVGTLVNLTVTNPIVGSITGNATTATIAGNITATTNTTLISLSNLATVGTITSGVWSGTAVAVEKGGTGLTSAGSIGKVLTSTGSGTLTWTTPVFLPTVVIGTQQWMEKNLDVMTYRNGDIIPQVSDPTAWTNLTTGAWCYYNNDPLNGAIYGKLYNWYAINDPRGLAPQGWHIPTDEEWTTLSTLLGGDAVAGGKMKTTGITRWTTPNTSATNESGFAGLPGGFRAHGGSFFDIGSNGYWWSASESRSISANAYLRDLLYNVSDLSRGSFPKRSGFSVRCLRD